MNKHTKFFNLHNIRRFSQAFFLLFFIFLLIQTESKGDDTLGYPVKIFLDIDPLIFLSNLLSSHAIALAFFFSLGLMVLTIALGRFFCGWVCPLGTLNNIAGAVKPAAGRSRNEPADPSAYRIKYYVLIFLGVTSLFGLQLTGVLDPLSLLIRSFALGILPLFNLAVRSVFDTVYNLNIPVVTGISEGIYDICKKLFLSFQQPLFDQGLLAGFLFFGILALNLVRKRFWCKYLCPLGALLGVLSRFSLLRRSVSEGCSECGVCAGNCQGAAIPDKKDFWKKTECLYCGNCDDVCPRNAVAFGFGAKPPGADSAHARTSMDLSRRHVIGSALAAAITVPLFRISPIFKAAGADPKLIRPPGSLEERDFLKRCVKCGECMKVCITNGLQPTFLEAGLEGIWSPLLVPRIGYCEYRCTLCGQVCPTGAIRRVGLEEKSKIRIGLAMIDKGRCLPYAHSTACIVCEEVCPVSPKAIWFEEVKLRRRDGKEVLLKQPRVDLDRCIGCGMCEAKCPLLGRPAIYVTSIGETRSKENRLFL